MTSSKTIWPFDKQGFAQVTGGKIWYGIVGNLETDKTPILVIHGGPGMSHDYLYPLTDIAKDRPVIFYDQLDAGLSDRPNNPNNWTISRFVNEVDELKTELGLGGLSIFGNSWGGTVAAAYAATQPRELDKLILSSPLIETSRWIDDNANYRAALPDSIKAIMDKCETNGQTHLSEYQTAVDLFYKRHLCRLDTWPDYVLDTFEILNEICYEGMWGPNEFTCNGVLRQYDGSSDLQFITVPTLVTCGEFDEATPNSCEHFANMIANAKCEVFTDASHLTFVETRETYMKSIREFLDG